MLLYLINVTQDCLITVTLLTLLYAVCGMIWKKMGKRLMRIFMLIGVLASIAMSIAKNTTSKIATNQWNFYIFICTILATLLFIIFSFTFGYSKKEEHSSASLLCPAFAGILASLLIFYKMPDLIAYPYQFNTGSDGILSIAFLVRLIGWLGGLILQLIYCRALYKSILAYNRIRLTIVLLDLGAAFNAFRCFGIALGKWTSKAKWLPSILPAYSKAEFPWAFSIVKFAANRTLLFMFGIAGLALLIPILLFIRNLKVHDLWENKAQHRRLRYICKKNRHAAATVAVCTVLCLLIMTVVQDYNNQEVTLSEPETYTIDGDYIYIDISQVDDGHLHRFEYTTDNGIDVRWIVIRKPDSAAYGVGLDACDICGDAGYYERGDQVVCKRCDVVMNTNTIGFSGGCNPIPLDYTIANGQMIFLLDDIIAGESKFK